MKTDLIEEYPIGKIIHQRPEKHPLDPESQNQDVISYLIQVHKHITKLPSYVTIGLLLIKIGIIFNTILSKTNESDILLYLRLNLDNIRYINYAAILINCNFILHFLDNIFFRKNSIKREELLKRDQIVKGFILIGFLSRFCYMLFYPVQVISYLSIINCNQEVLLNLAKSQGIENYEEMCSSEFHYIEIGIFGLNLLLSLILNQIFNAFYIGIHPDGDPLSSMSQSNVNFFQILMIWTYFIKNIINWNAHLQDNRLRFLYGTTIIISATYLYIKESKKLAINKVVEAINKTSCGFFIWLSIKKFLMSFFIDGSQTKLESLMLVLDCVFILKITYNMRNSFRIKLLDSEKFNFMKSLIHNENRGRDLSKLTYMLAILQKLMTMNEKKLKRYDFEILELKGYYKNHQKKCLDVNCSCQKKSDVRYGKDDLRRFRDFFIIQFNKTLKMHDNSFTFLWHKIYFIYSYEKNLKKISLNLQKLKKMANTVVKKYRLLQLELKIEKLFINSYKNQSQVDGQDSSKIGSISSKEVTLEMANNYIFRGKNMTEYLKLENYITIDRLMNEMIDRMKEGIDIHQIFLEKVQEKSTKIKDIHKLIVIIKELHRRVDKVYIKLRAVSFRYTTIYLLPYAFFMNQTQNRIRLCNEIVKEFRQKKTTFAKLHIGDDETVKNVNLEQDSVCMMISFSKDTFLDIVYITQTYQQVFGADMSFLSANLRDILPPKIADLHQKVTEKYLDLLDVPYLSTQKSSLITLKENIYDKVVYVVKLFPSLLLEPMLILYIKKKEIKKNKFLMVLDKKGIIEGFSHSLVKLYPTIMESKGKKIYKMSKDLKKMINDFKFYELAVVQSLKHKASIYLPGFRPSKIKLYKEEWNKMTVDRPNEGKKATISFNEKLRIKVNFRLKASYLKYKNESDYLIWFYFNIDNEFDRILLRTATLNQGKLKFKAKARRGLMKINYINKIRMFKSNRDDDSKRLVLGFNLNESINNNSNTIKMSNYSREEKEKKDVANAAMNRAQFPTNFKRRDKKKGTILDLKKERKFMNESRKMEKRVNRKSMWFGAPAIPSKAKKDSKRDNLGLKNKRRKTEKVNRKVKIHQIDKVHKTIGEKKASKETVKDSNGFFPMKNMVKDNLNIPTMDMPTSIKLIQKNGSSKYIGFDNKRTYLKQPSRKSITSSRVSKERRHTFVLTSENNFSFNKGEKGKIMNTTQRMTTRKRFRSKKNFQSMSVIGSEAVSMQSTSSTGFSRIITAVEKSRLVDSIKTNFIVLIVQVITLMLAFLSLAVIRIYYSDENIKYLSQFRASEVNLNINTEIKTAYSNIMKLGLFQTGYIAENYFENFTKEFEGDDWVLESGMDKPEDFYLEDMRYRIRRLGYLVEEMKQLTTRDMPDFAITKIYNNTDNIVTYPFFKSGIIRSVEDSNNLKNLEKMNILEATSFLTLIFNYSYHNNDYNLMSGVPFITIDKNILQGFLLLTNKLTFAFTQDSISDFDEQSSFGTTIVLYCCFVILGINLCSLPSFMKMRNKVTFVYRILEELYNFEIVFKLKILDELEDALDVCQENGKIMQGLVHLRYESSRLYIKLKMNDTRKDFRSFQKECLYSYGLLVPFVLIIAVGVFQSLYNFNTYSYCRTKISQFQEFSNIQKSTYSLAFNVPHMKYLFDREIINDSNMSIKFDSYRNEKFNSFFKQINHSSLRRDKFTKEFMDYIYMEQKIDGSNKAFDYLIGSPCDFFLNVSKDDYFNRLNYLEIPDSLCRKLGDQLSSFSFAKSFSWVVHQEKLIRNKMDEIKGEEGRILAEIFTTKAYIDYDLYVRFVFEPYMRRYKVELEKDLTRFSDTVNNIVENLTFYGVIMSSILCFIVYYIYHQKSKELLTDCIYIVRLLPWQTLSQNTYVKSRLVKILKLNTY